MRRSGAPWGWWTWAAPSATRWSCASTPDRRRAYSMPTDGPGRRHRRRMPELVTEAGGLSARGAVATGMLAWRRPLRRRHRTHPIDADVPTSEVRQIAGDEGADT